MASSSDLGIPGPQLLATNPRLPAVVSSVAVSAGKVNSDAQAKSLCVNTSWWTHLFPNQNTGRFLMLGPNLLNSCIIETDYLHSPARQFVTYSLSLAQGVVAGNHLSLLVQEASEASYLPPSGV